MTDINYPAEAVEAAAKALEGNTVTWDAAAKETFREDARAAIDAIGVDELVKALSRLMEHRPLHRLGSPHKPAWDQAAEVLARWLPTEEKT